MKTNRTLLALKAVLTLTVALVLTGCNQALVGTWKSDPTPKDDLIQAEFKEDGTFNATANKDGEVVKLGGTYDFNGFSLKLKAPHKPDREYGATLLFGKTLDLTHEDSKLTMKKQ
ncbi:MAG: hypothetical protein JXQ75_03340 [Phycisphaerae bacterium]|nr:hypothetical protein [Phycisphaerae bacterium]